MVRATRTGCRRRVRLGDRPRDPDQRTPRTSRCATCAAPAGAPRADAVPPAARRVLMRPHLPSHSAHRHSAGQRRQRSRRAHPRPRLRLRARRTLQRRTILNRHHKTFGRSPHTARPTIHRRGRFPSSRPIDRADDFNYGVISHDKSGQVLSRVTRWPQKYRCSLLLGSLRSTHPRCKR